MISPAVRFAAEWLHDAPGTVKSKKSHQTEWTCHIIYSSDWLDSHLNTLTTIFKLLNSDQRIHLKVRRHSENRHHEVQTLWAPGGWWTPGMFFCDLKMSSEGTDVWMVFELSLNFFLASRLKREDEEQNHKPSFRFVSLNPSDFSAPFV